MGITYGDGPLRVYEERLFGASFGTGCYCGANRLHDIILLPRVRRASVHMEAMGFWRSSLDPVDRTWPVI